jgi:2-polyprenyl-3-methyl-5-hydroxy-6-metoxy-1,4-benzoquinol methylase
MQAAVDAKRASIRTVPVRACPVCGDAGTLLHADLVDALFDAGGRWSIRACGAKDCGTAWLDPRPIVEDLGQAYASYYTHSPAAATQRWDDRLFTWLRTGYLAGRYGHRRDACSAIRRWLGGLLRLHPDLGSRVDLQAFYLEPVPGGRFLEIGCGSGEHLAAMRDLGWQVQGIDADADAVRTAQQRGLPVQCGMVKELGFAPASFDAIGLCHVIEHVDDPVDVLRTCRELLVPGGRLTLVTPNIQSVGHARFGRHWLALDPPRHLRLYSCAALRATVRAAGFTETTVKTTVRAGRTQFVASRSIRRTGRWTWGDRGTFVDGMSARLLQLSTFLGLGLRPQSGEEIVVVALR